MKVSDLGEFGLIERLAEVLYAQGGAALSGRLAVGIGDDAAVWRGDGAAIIATTDTLVQDVHFVSGHTPWCDLGWKALAVNLSDIAAMGGTPDFALVTLVLSGEEDADALDELYRGLAQAGEQFGVAIAGGDVVRGPATVITVALTGHGELDSAGEPLVLRRSAANEGDVVAVTGALGGAMGGLRMLREDGGESADAHALIARHLRPQPRLEAGRAALAAGVRCGIDVSDGLLQDLGHVCKASRLGATVWRDKIPIDPALRAFDGDEALRCAVAGGEDYELLLIGDAAQMERLQAAFDVPLTVIGEMVIDKEHRAVLLDEHAKEIEMPSGGWDHLRGDG
jgi:thiamine-monophosphate kinase